MAKAKRTEAKVKAPAAKEEVTRHARIELSDSDYELVKSVAKRDGLSLAAYIRMAVLQRARRDQAESGR
ncbi:hypothetical protein OJF2_79270 (plasmid) [Aquisphaera giovannonii]|uniref:Ribbon-helix-helix protein CopG domain-containing protein n=1 Tax=Aquisphaera giovannonii TaxID=406548 RepID=A0A5B9WFG1_9BACT|nr:hypothetical protein [Aquisphaera giovannonii]QEH39312.1 hypothetical protein OJF2_79270 [Aquisphaera giovannonii]